MPTTTNERIVERHNDAINYIIEAYELGSEFQLNGAMNKIDSAASAIYQSLEWFLKKYLMDFYPDKELNKSEYLIIEGNSFYKKIRLFSEVAQSEIASFEVKTSIVIELKQSVRNDPEHSGIVPHFQSLLLVINEVHKILKNFMSNSENLKSISCIENFKLELPTNENWTDFFSMMDKFEAERNYVLVTNSNIRSLREVLKPLGLIDWNVILDFDNESCSLGLYDFISSELSSRRTIHQFTCNDPIIDLSAEGATYWVFANGLDGRSDTSFSSYKDWNRVYSAYLNRFILKIQRNLSEKPTTVLFLLDSLNYTNELVRLFYNHLGNSVKFVFADLALNNVNHIIDEYSGDKIEISTSQISNGILQFRNYFNESVHEDFISIPHKEHGYVEIKNEDFIWIEEGFSVIHRNIINDNIASYEFGKKADFYRGGEIDWGGLHFNLDIRRDAYHDLKTKVEKKSKDRMPAKLNIFHYPGIGGSTISKRLAWDLHKNYPVAILKKYKKTDSINRVYKIFQLSSLPPIVIIDSSKVDETDLDSFYSELQQRNFPSVFINVQRYSNHKLLPKESIHLSEVLSDIELASFVSIFSDLAPHKKEDLRSVLNTSEGKRKHPFYLGLIAFEKEFENLIFFVKKAIIGASVNQKNILTYISFCDVYAQRQLSAQIFSKMLLLVESSVVRLDSVLTPAQLYLLSNEKSVDWKALHYLIAKQILLEIHGNGNNEVLYKNALTSISIEFIELLASKSFSISDGELDILNQLFISRGMDQEVQGSEETQFSKLISDGIPDDSSRLQIFLKLTEKFPNQSHFWSHLARFYNFKVKDSDKAFEAINQAIEIEDQFEVKDSTLYHIKGMILRSKLRRLSNKSEMSPNAGSATVKNEIMALFEQSSASFEMAREINPKDEYGYISDIELTISYLDFKFKMSGLENRAIFLSKLNAFDLQALEKAEILLEDIKVIKAGQEDGFYIRRCSAQILEYYSDYSTIIQNWNNLLDNSNEHPKESIRRQLIRAYVGRARGWESLSAREIERVLTLIEDNISENASSIQNISLWFRTARTTESITIEASIEKVSRWRILKQTLEANYYLTCLHVILAINGNSTSKLLAERLLRETSEMSRFNTNRSYSQNWLGVGRNLKQFVPNRTATSKDISHEIVYNKDLLYKITGKIVEIKGPESGYLELECGLKVFFIPARAFKGEGAMRDKHLNDTVLFYLGFSYDGLRGFDISKS